MVDALAIVIGIIFLIVCLGFWESIVDEIDYWFYSVFWLGYKTRRDQKWQERNSQEIRGLMGLLWGDRRESGR